MLNFPVPIETCLIYYFAEHVFFAFLAIPLVYELDKNLKPLKHYYLATDDEVKAALDKVANQGKAKPADAPRTSVPAAKGKKWPARSSSVQISDFCNLSS